MVFGTPIMNKAEEVFERLKAGTPWRNAKEGVGSSSVYGGYNLFDAWAGPRVNEVQVRIKEVETRLQGLQEQEKRLDDEAKSKTAVIGDLSAWQQALENGNATLETRASLLGEQVKKTEEGLKTLEARGITPDIIEAVAGTDADAPELIKRIKTGKEQKALETKVEELHGVEQNLNKGNAALEEKRENLKTEVTSEGNTLDEVKRKTVFFRESQLVVQDAFSRGYSSETLTALFAALKRIEVKGHSNTSILRLLKGLEGEKTLDEQQSKLKQVDSELEETTKNLDQVKGSMRAAVNTFVPTLINAQNKALAEITTFRDAVNSSMDELARQRQTSFSKMEADAEKKLTNMNSLVNAEAGVLHDRLIMLYRTLNLSFEVYQGKIKKWGEIQMEAGKYEATLRIGSYIQTLITDPKQAANLPPDLALLFANSLHSYVEDKLPKATTQPPPHIIQREATLPRFTHVQLRSLTGWIHVDLADRRLRGEI